ncbi:MAG: M28 family peptidase [Chloroflexota bacterium]
MQIHEVARGAPQRGPTSTRAGGRGLASVALFLGLGLALWLGLLPLWTLPGVAPATAPAESFSAERALAHLRVIAQEPHPLGSSANSEVREYILAELRALGLQPEVQTTTAVNNFPGVTTFSTGTVHNIVARLPGTASTGAIALDAHYDAATSGPGASDCGSCVAGLLETARALRAGPALRNDVIFVFTDGEENQDLGAAAFVAEHPLAKDVRLALNFEAMAVGGPSVLYFTSQNNSWLISEYARAATLPLASSAVTTLMDLFPSQQFGCDLAEYTLAGAAGLGFIYFGEDIPAYHTARDSIDLTDPRSIQHHGLNALNLTHHFGNLDLGQATRPGAEVFFNVRPGVLVHYPASWAAPLAGLAGLLWLGLVALGWRRRALSVGGLMVGLLALPLSALLALAAAGLAWAGLKVANPDLLVYMIGNYASETFLLGLAALVAAVVTALYGALFARVRVANLAAGAALLWAVLGLLVALSLPGMSYVFTWPLLFGLLALGWQLGASARHPAFAVATLALAAAPGVALVAQVVGITAPLFIRLDALLGAALGQPLPLLPVPLLLVGLLGGLLLPQLAVLAGAGPGAAGPRAGRRLRVAGLALLAAVLLLGVGWLQSGFGPQQPRPTSVAYQLDADTGASTWVTVDRQANVWSAQFFPQGVARASTTYPLLGLAAWSVPAPRLDLAAPRATVLADSVADGVRQLSLRLDSPRQASTLAVMAQASGEILAASLNGKPLDLGQFAPEERQEVFFQYYGLPATGVELALRVRSAEPLRLTLLDRSTGLPSIPGLAVQPRPQGFIAAPDMPDPTVVRQSFTIGR